MASHSSTLAWKIPWEKPGRYNPWGRKESDTTDLLTYWASFPYAFVFQVVFTFYEIARLESSVIHKFQPQKMKGIE